jgi:hypothetical protein
MKEDVKFLLKYYDQLEAERTMWCNVWQDINDYILPFKQPIRYDEPEGTQRGDVTIFDSTPTHAVFRLAAALNSLLTNPTSEWFMLETDDDFINKQVESQQWFKTVTSVIMRVLENSNFYTEVNEMYIDLVSYGTGVLYIEPSKMEDKEINFSARSVREVCVAENVEGLIDTVARRMKLTARQMVEEFGDAVSDDVKKKLNEDPESKFDVIHIVFPRTEYEFGKKTPENKKFASIWLEKDKEHLLRRSGYDTFPFVVARWLKETGEKYGRSPAMNSLADIKTLNEMVRTLLVAGQKIADPPVMVPDEGFGDVTTQPGKIIYYDPTYKSRVEPLIFGANLPLTFDMVSEKRQIIADAFYMNQLLLIDKRELTAEEVRARQGENARILAPTFGMLNFEFLAPLIERVLDILHGVLDYDREPVIPVAPTMLQNKKFKLKFISPLAKSQRIHEIQSILHSVNVAVSWAQANPDILDNIDWDLALRTVSDIDGSSANILRSMEQVAQIRMMRLQQQQQQMQIEQAAQGAETFNEASKGLRNMDRLENVRM